MPPAVFNTTNDEISYPVVSRIIGGPEVLRLMMLTPTPDLPRETESELASVTSAALSSDTSREGGSDAEGVPRRWLPNLPKRTP